MSLYYSMLNKTNKPSRQHKGRRNGVREAPIKASGWLSRAEVFGRRAVFRKPDSVQIYVRGQGEPCRMIPVQQLRCRTRKGRLCWASREALRERTGDAGPL